LKLALNDAVVAVTAYEPAIVFAVNAGARATPDAFVTVLYVRLPSNVPLAPLDGAVKVTAAFATALLFPSTTCTCNPAAKLVFTIALCGVPPVAVIAPAAPAVFVSRKFPAVAPATDAVTL
jgi:hypothetical protein